MTSLINLDILNDNRGRWVVVAEAFAPMIIGICSCCVLYKEEISNEKRAFLCVSYIVVTLLWGFSLFISSMNFDDIALILFASVSAVLLAIALYCLFLMHSKHRHLFRASLFFLALVIEAIVLAMTSPSLNTYAPMVTAMTLTPLAFSVMPGLSLDYTSHHTALAT